MNFEADINSKEKAGRKMSKERRNEIKKKQQTKKIAAVVVAVVAVVAVIATALVMNVHKCDDCGVTIFGSGYYKEEVGEGVLGSVFGSIFGDTESVALETVEGAIICEECAMNNTSVKAELRPVSDFKR